MCKIQPYRKAEKQDDTKGKAGCHQKPVFLRYLLDRAEESLVQGDLSEIYGDSNQVMTVSNKDNPALTHVQNPALP